MKKLFLPLMRWTLLAVLLAGCSGPNIISVGLHIELEHIDRAADGSVLVTWRMLNPNIATYLVKMSSHKIMLNGTLIGTTAQKGPLGLPAQQNAEETTPLVSAGAAADQVITAAAAAGTASYKVDTDIVIQLFDEALDRSTLTNSGTVKVAAK